MNIPGIIKEKVRFFSAQDYDRQADFVSRLFYLNLLMAIFIMGLFFTLRLEVRYPNGETKKETIKSMLFSKIGLKR